MNEGLISWIKYAIVREDPAVDPYLTRLIDLVDRKLIVSGIGEQSQPSSTCATSVSPASPPAACAWPLLCR